MSSEHTLILGMQGLCIDELQQGTTVLSACTGAFSRSAPQLVICSQNNFTLWTIDREPQLLQTCPLFTPARHVSTVAAQPLDQLLVWHLDGGVSVWAHNQEGSLHKVHYTRAATAWKDPGQPPFLPQSSPTRLPDGEVVWATHAGGGACAVWRLLPGKGSPEPVVGEHCRASPAACSSPSMPAGMHGISSRCGF